MATIDQLITDMTTYPVVSSSVVSTAQAAEFVNGALRRMVRMHNWRCMQQSVDLTVTSTGVVTLPPDFSSVAAIYAKVTATDPAQSLMPIVKVQKPAWYSQISPLNTTDPVFPSVAVPSNATNVLMQQRAYTMWSGVLTILPTPGSALTLQMDYYRTLEDLVPALPVPDRNPLTVLYADVVRWGALVECYDFLHEEERSTKAEASFSGRLKAAVDHDNAIAFAGLPQSRGK